MLRDFFKRRSAKRKLAQAQEEFDASARALVEANRATRANGNTVTPELLLAGEKNLAALQALVKAKHDINQATGGPEPVELTDMVRRKVHQMFPAEEHANVIRMLEKECGRGLPFNENASPADLERVRLAVLKLSCGNISQLQQQIGVAKTDWRNVLIAAEQPEVLEVGLVEYANFPASRQDEIDARDRQQYELWLNEEAQ